MPMPAWTGPLAAHFEWIESSEGLTLICRQCGDEIVFSTHARQGAILGAMDAHVTEKHGYNV